MDKIMLFVSAVVAHLLFTFGGVAIVAFGLYENFKHKETQKWIFWGLAAMLLLVAFYQAWTDEHNNSTNLISEKSSLWAKYNDCNAGTREYAADSRSLNARLNDKQKRIDSQQDIIDSQLSTVTSCIATLTKTNIPEPLRIITKAAAIKGQKPPAFILSAETNRRIPGYSGKIRCGSAFALIQADMVLGMMSYSPSYQQKAGQTEVDINFSGTAWDTHEPIIAIVQGEGLTSEACSVTSQ